MTIDIQSNIKRNLCALKKIFVLTKKEEFFSVSKESCVFLALFFSKGKKERIPGSIKYQTDSHF
jgi:hypothetical protein